MDTAAEKTDQNRVAVEVYDDGNAPTVNQRKDAVAAEKVAGKCVAAGNIRRWKPSRQRITDTRYRDRETTETGVAAGTRRGGSLGFF
jgi:hypothetical protein